MVFIDKSWLAEAFLQVTYCLIRLLTELRNHRVHCLCWVTASVRPRVRGTARGFTPGLFKCRK